MQRWQNILYTINAGLKCLQSHISYLFFFICRFLTTKDKFHEFVDSGWKGPKGHKTSDNDKPEEEKETSVEEPETKKFKVDPEERNKVGKPDGKRIRGQNKSRPHTKPNAFDEKRLCPSVIQVENVNKSFWNTT